MITYILYIQFQTFKKENLYLFLSVDRVYPLTQGCASQHRQLLAHITEYAIKVLHQGHKFNWVQLILCLRSCILCPRFFFLPRTVGYWTLSQCSQGKHPGQTASPPQGSHTNTLKFIPRCNWASPAQKPTWTQGEHGNFTQKGWESNPGPSYCEPLLVSSLVY